MDSTTQWLPSHGRTLSWSTRIAPSGLPEGTVILHGTHKRNSGQFPCLVGGKPCPVIIGMQQAVDNKMNFVSLMVAAFLLLTTNFALADFSSGSTVRLSALEIAESCPVTSRGTSIEFSPVALFFACVDLGCVSTGDLIGQHLAVSREPGAFDLRIWFP